MLDCLHAWVMLGDDAACLSGLSVGLFPTHTFIMFYPDFPP